MSHQSDDDICRLSWQQHHHQPTYISVPGEVESTIPIQTISTPTPAAVFGMTPSSSQQQTPTNVCYSPGHPETYSVLPVGHGNFLKVYHTADAEQSQIIYNSYELFANNTMNQPMPQQLIANNIAPTLNEEVLLMDGMHSIPLHPTYPTLESPGTATNMIINKLVNNWSPNLTGSYTQFGENNVPVQPMNTYVPVIPATGQENQYVPTVDNNVQAVLSNKAAAPSNTVIVTPVSVPNVSNAKSNADSSTNSTAPEVRKRIVAEVKPMRMSYSDVLSKINSQSSVNSHNATNPSATNTQGSDTTTQPIKQSKLGSVFSEKPRPILLTTDRKMPLINDDKERIENIGSSRKQGEQQNIQQPTLNYPQTQRGDKKKSPVHESKEPTQILNPSGNKTKKNLGKPQVKLSSKQTPSNPSNGDPIKKRSSRRDDDQNSYSGNKSSPTNRNYSNLSSSDKEGYYNVTKTENSYDRAPKYTSQHYSASSRKVRQSNGISFNSKLANSRYEKQQQLYSSNKRNQNRSGQRSVNKYDLMKKLFDKWLLEYTIKILNWLFYLVYDIVVLGCSIFYEWLITYSSCAYIHFANLRNDFKNNSNRPSIWLRNYLKKIDSKFRKNSRWAFWRRFYKKKVPEPSQEFYENGRLPQTGEEAMYSLLNCKGKDAYSILGVPASCSQEQIRKHYKKIAVLVHPDKNKQPGAEEAFKVLQRAFELIGEPDNRVAYDQSLVEALHAEKAWTELHDLLSQLQTKIAEAANTIRCSSCGLRHPRKITDRPHYAARECGTCKIRHSAREGDIWAETSWLRLRWKYLALMEGKVYDITEWANCQKGALSHLEPNSHMVQYRIVRGSQQQQQSQHTTNHQQQQKQQKQQNLHQENGKYKREAPSESSLDDFLDNLYSGQIPHGQQQNSSRRRGRRT